LGDVKKRSPFFYVLKMPRMIGQKARQNLSGLGVYHWNLLVPATGGRKDCVGLAAASGATGALDISRHSANYLLIAAMIVAPMASRLGHNARMGKAGPRGNVA
jgi:hypothetical protein